MEISILAVNCRTFRFNRPCTDGPFGSSRNNPPQRGAGTRDEPMEGRSLCMTQLGSGNDFACRGKRGKLQTLPKVAVGRRPFC